MEFPIHNGIAYIDERDYAMLSLYKWRVDKDGYAVAWSKQVNGKRQLLKMHRLILGVDDRSILVDHKNNNKLDNRAENLREATVQQNAMNRKRNKDKKSSNYKGVFLERNRYRARIAYNGKYISIGTYSTELEAVIAYNKKAIELYGEFACLNTIPQELSNKEHSW